MGFIRALIRLPLILWVIAIGGYLYYSYTNWRANEFEPLKGQIESTKEQFARVQKQNREAEAFAKDRDARFAELQTLAEDFNRALEKLPKSSDTPGLLSNLAEISDRVGVEFTRFEPGSPTLNGFLMETPFKVELKGSFVQVMSFLDEVAHLKRIVSGRTISLKDPVLRGSNAMLTAEATLLTYYFDENARPSNNANSPTNTTNAAPDATTTQESSTSSDSTKVGK